jgi:hypothetical protein
MAEKAAKSETVKQDVNDSTESRLRLSRPLRRYAGGRICMESPLATFLRLCGQRNTACRAHDISLFYLAERF